MSKENENTNEKTTISENRNTDINPKEAKQTAKADVPNKEFTCADGQAEADTAKAESPTEENRTVAGSMESDRSEAEEKTFRKKHGKQLLFAVCAILTLLLLAYAFMANYYTRHFLPNTYIDAVAVGNLNREEALLKLRDAGSRSLIFVTGSGKTETLDLNACGFYRAYDAPDGLFAAQETLLWLSSYREKKELQLPFTPMYDEEKLSASLHALPMMQKEAMEAPKDAYIREAETGGFEIVPETMGSTVMEPVLWTVMERALKAGENRIDLLAEGCYEAAAVRAEDAELLDTLARFNRYDEMELRLDLSAGVFEEIGGDLIHRFLLIEQEEGKAAALRVDEEEIKSYLTELAARYDTATDTGRRLFNTQSGRTVSIRTFYGWKLDVEKTAVALKASIESYFEEQKRDAETEPLKETEEAADDADETEIEAETDKGEAGEPEPATGTDTEGVTETETKTEAEGRTEAETNERVVEAVWKRKAVSHKPRDIGDTYAEVDIGNQTVYFVKDKELVFTSPCVTGKLTRDRATPDGIYTLSYKQPGKVLTGYKPDGSIDYQSPVSFWMPFNGGIGFHDATWRYSFGGTIYKNSGSHGCINMPYQKAKELYSLVYKGVPVVCYF